MGINVASVERHVEFRVNGIVTAVAFDCPIVDGERTFGLYALCIAASHLNGSSRDAHVPVSFQTLGRCAVSVVRIFLTGGDDLQITSADGHLHVCFDAFASASGALYEQQAARHRKCAVTFQPSRSLGVILATVEGAVARSLHRGPSAADEDVSVGFYALSGCRGAQNIDHAAPHLYRFVCFNAMVGHSGYVDVASGAKYDVLIAAYVVFSRSVDCE